MCQNFKENKDGSCSHYDEENYGDMGTARFCRLDNKLVEYIPECPMSITKCEGPEEDFEDWQEIKYSQALAGAYEDPAEKTCNFIVDQQGVKMKINQKEINYHIGNVFYSIGLSEKGRLLIQFSMSRV